MIIFYFVDLVEENIAKIKIKFLEINFGRKKLSEVTLYTRTTFTRKLRWEKFALPVCCVE